jgi:hypothetical protein
VPLATIQRAKQLVRDQRSHGFASAVDVLLHNGTYEVAQPLTFDAMDGGVSFVAPTTYKAAPGARPVLIGGKVLKLDWIKDTAAPMCGKPNCLQVYAMNQLTHCSLAGSACGELASRTPTLASRPSSVEVT